MITNKTMINSSVRTIRAKAELYNGSALVNTYSYNNALVSIDIERVGETSKFFGFGICQKINIKLRDVNREISINTDNSFKIYFSSDSEGYVSSYPPFYVTEVNRDENTNQLSITAYDKIKNAEKHTVSELGLSSYTIEEFAAAAASLIGATGLEIIGVGEAETCFNTVYSEGANFDGTETIREALNAVAEATQTIYYLNSSNKLVFKRLDSGDADLTISKADYISLESKTNRRLATIASVTELGDNVSVSTLASGSTQYVRDNPFWELREDIGDLLNNAIAAIGGLTINQFDCSWRGNYLLEIGDKIALVNKDDSIAYSYVLNDTISYNGAFSEKTSWAYTDSSETESTPATIGEAIKQTYARVDKANKQIDIVASETNSNTEAIAALQINTESINATVSKMEEVNESALEDINDNINALKSQVSTQITPEDVKIEIQKELENGTNKVVTATGYTFDEDGLTVSKTGSEITTQITEDGMKINKNDTGVLTANNEGVTAIDLHAKTYLIIGTNSRFENYGSNRTGCFWIGG